MAALSVLAATMLFLSGPVVMHVLQAAEILSLNTYEKILFAIVFPYVPAVVVWLFAECLGGVSGTPPLDQF